MVKLANRVLFAVAMFCTSASYGSDYYWMLFSNSGSSLYSEQFPTPSSACSFLAEQDTSSKQYEFIGLVLKSEGDFYCQMIVTTNGVSAPPGNYGRAIRRGDSCPVNTDYDSQTGECAVPAGEAGEPCDGPELAGMPAIYNSAGACVRWDLADTPATCKALFTTGTTFTDVYVAFDGDGNPEKPQIEKFGCAVQVVDVANCKMPVPRCGAGICVEHSITKCRVGVTFSGEVAGDSNGTGYPISDGPGTEGVCPEGVDCTPPDEPVIEESKPCNYMYNGEVVGCESSEFKGNPGEMNCGSFNGGPYECTKKVPTSNGIDIRTQIKTEAQPDGTTKQTKTDVAKKTVCSAPGSCTTQVTTNTNVTIKDGAGNTLSSSDSCVGPNCSKDGAGTGDGETNCPPGEECEEGFGGPENEEVPGFGESLGTFMSAVSGSPIVSAASDAFSIPSGGSCSFQPFTVPILGTLSFQQICSWASDWLAPLRLLMLAVWAIVAVRTFLEA